METYEQQRRAFRWSDERAKLGLLPSDGVNIGFEAVDRHVAEGNGERVAIRWLPKAGPPLDITYAQLQGRTNCFANVLEKLGCASVATLAGRIPLLYVAALGTLKAGGVYTPLFSAFGPDPISMRMNLGRIEVLVTTAQFYRRKVAQIRHEMPSLRYILLTDGTADDGGDDSILDLPALMERASDTFVPARTESEDWALLHFTSGTTGTPKGAIHVHGAVVGHAATGRMVFQMTPRDIYWCTADPGWVTGTSYGIISPLVNGVTSVIDEAEFDAERWYRTIEQESVNILYTAPTALRMIKRAGTALAGKFDLSSLRLVASVGEPLDAETVRWARAVFDVPVLDNWWQTETGAIMISNLPGELVKPGSMGRPLPGIEAGLLATDENGELVIDGSGDPTIITSPDQVGELAIRAGWPSMFRGYLNQPERYATSFVGPWYHSGDLAKRDVDDYYWFVGRNNDVIKSAGHLIGPFEVESALIEHGAVVEAGVIGKPDPMAGNIVKAFVVLARGNAPSEELRRELIGHARKRLGAAVAPREIEFADTLPHTRSGKIMRRVLQARELGIEAGDLSTLEVPV